MIHEIQDSADEPFIVMDYVDGDIAGHGRERSRLFPTSGEERQLTFDQKIIDEVKWTTQDNIIFSSTRSGNTNLWMMPAQGGEAVQITKGSRPDIGMAMSSDMKKLLYLQQFEIGNIWLVNSDGSDSRQITF